MAGVVQAYYRGQLTPQRWGQDMRFEVALLSVVAVGVVALGLVGSAQAAGGPVYGLSASYATFPCAGIDCPLEPPYDWSGSAECVARCTGVPQGGSFVLELAGWGKRYPPSPCLTKRVKGTFSASWSDGSFTTASLTGRLRNGQAYSVKGIVDTTSTAYPTDPIKGSATWPSDPTTGQRNGCLDGTMSWPTDPIFVSFGS
jgi:hypothetical protein